MGCTKQNRDQQTPKLFNVKKPQYEKNNPQDLVW